MSCLICFIISVKDMNCYFYFILKLTWVIRTHYHTYIRITSHIDDSIINSFLELLAYLSINVFLFILHLQQIVHTYYTSIFTNKLNTRWHINMNCKPGSLKLTIGCMSTQLS